MTILFLVGGVVAPSGCDSSPSKPLCQNDDQCGGGGTCVKGTCLPPPTGRIVAVEILPPAGSLSGPTELPNVMLSGDDLTLMAADKATVLGSVSSPNLFATEAHVAITIPSLIPGRADLAISAEMASNQFTFTTAQSRLGGDTSASFRFIPGSMAQTQPPVSFNKKALIQRLSFAFPTTAQMTVIRGVLYDASGAPFASDAYPARASFNSAQVSNVVTTDARGLFTLLVPPGATGDAPDDRVALTIGTAGDPKMVPVLITNPVSLSTFSVGANASTPRIYSMPGFAPAQPVVLRVQAEGKGLAGVTVRLRTDIPAMDGVGRYERSGVTDTHGEVTLSLIPGADMAARLYQASIEAPADASFRYGSQCIGDVPIALGTTGEIVAPEAFTLQPKLALSGSISDRTAAPVASARVTATEIGGATACSGAAVGNALSTTTDPSGNYLLLVEPGTYHLEVEPGRTSQWPRRAEIATLTVTHPTVHPIVLPGGELVKGRVVGSDNATLVPGASVTIFQIDWPPVAGAASAPPVILAQTETDAAGTFQVVLPGP